MPNGRRLGYRKVVRRFCRNCSLQRNRQGGKCHDDSGNETQETGMGLYIFSDCRIIRSPHRDGKEDI